MAGSKESSGNGQKNENIDNKWANLGEQSSAESAITNRDVEYFKENPAELSNLVTELVQMRPLEKDKRAGYDKDMHADVDRNGLPLGASHLVGYLKKNPEDIKLVLSEYQQLQKQQEALTQDADHFKEHPEDLNALCGALISMRSEEKRKDGVWDKDQMARIGADGMPTEDAAHLTKYLREHPDDIEKVLTEAQQLGRAEQYAKDNSAFFRNNPDQIFKMTTELYQLRGGTEAGAGKGFNADGIPNNPAQLTHYLREHPGKIRPFLKELAMLRYESGDGYDADKKLEEMSERGADYNPSNDFSGEQNIGPNGKERSYSNFDTQPRQKGETPDEYGAQFRYAKVVADFMEKNPIGKDETQATWRERLYSLGMPTLEEFRKNELAERAKAETSTGETTDAETTDASGTGEGATSEKAPTAKEIADSTDSIISDIESAVTHEDLTALEERVNKLLEQSSDAVKARVAYSKQQSLIAKIESSLESRKADLAKFPLFTFPWSKRHKEKAVAKWAVKQAEGDLARSQDKLTRLSERLPSDLSEDELVSIKRFEYANARLENARKDVNIRSLQKDIKMRENWIATRETMLTKPIAERGRRAADDVMVGAMAGEGIAKRTSGPSDAEIMTAINKWKAEIAAYQKRISDYQAAHPDFVLNPKAETDAPDTTSAAEKSA